MRPATIFDTAEAAEEAFYDAMQRGDLAAMMSLWADDDDAVCIHPGGARLAGLAAIRDGFEAIFASGGLEIRPSRVRAVRGASIEVRTLVERIVAVEGGKSRVIECAATNVYVKSALGWRILLHHGGPAVDPASAGSAAAESVPPGKILH